MKMSLLTVLKGAAMGIAEVIPGVSGGTIAFITGIYERLLNAIRAIHPRLWGVFKETGIKGVWQTIDGGFLLKLFGGMGLGFGVGLFAIVHWLENNPIHIWSFFFGLILASIPLVASKIHKWTWKEMVLGILGAAGVYWVTIAAPSQGSEHLLLVFLSGVVGVSALMLPGLSGSFVLLLLGMYGVIMPSVRDFISSPFGESTWIVLAFGLGMLVGLFSFARVLSWTFKRYHNQTLAVLTGFLLGSLNKVWPWQEVVQTRINSKGEEVVYLSNSILPNQLEALDNNFLYGTESHLAPAMAIMALGVILVWIMHRFSPKA